MLKVLEKESVHFNRIGAAVISTIIDRLGLFGKRAG
jgi:hypothetical protein